MVASLGGHTATVRVLVDAGADKEAKGNVRERQCEIRSHTYAQRVWQRGVVANEYTTFL